MTEKGEKIISDIENFVNLINEIETKMNTLCEEERKINDEINDILHEIEFSIFDASGGYMLSKELKNLRSKRREIKKEKELLSHVQQFYNNNKNLPITLFKTLSTVKKAHKTQQERKYYPRSRYDLKISQATKNITNNKNNGNKMLVNN